MKVYYQRIDNTTCYFNDLEGLKGALETEIDSYYYGNSTVTDKDLDNMYIKALEEIEKLEVGKGIEFCESEWGLTEMSVEEFNNLDEFEGF